MARYRRLNQRSLRHRKVTVTKDWGCGPLRDTYILVSVLQGSGTAALAYRMISLARVFLACAGGMASDYFARFLFVAQIRPLQLVLRLILDYNRVLFLWQLSLSIYFKGVRVRTVVQINIIQCSECLKISHRMSETTACPCYPTR